MSKIGTTYHPSIINTILGPITLGPSSSHMAGPVRLGRLALELLDFKPKRIDIIYNRGGSFAETYKGHRTDCAMIAGLLGWDTDNLKIPKANEEAKKRGLEINIIVKPIATKHPNCVLFKIFSGSEQRIDILGASEGGGSINIFQIDKHLVNLDGQRSTLLILLKCKSDKSKKYILSEIQKISKGAKLKFSDSLALTIELEEEVSLEELEKIRKYPEVVKVYFLHAVFFCPKPGASRIPLFNSNDELLIMAEKYNLKLSEIGMRYEMNRLGWTPEEIKSKIVEMVYVMKNALKRGLSENLKFSGGIVKQGGKILIEAYRQGRTLCSGTLPKATAYAMSINEVSASLGLIVAAPTAGACGVVPGALFAVAEELGVDKNIDILANALLSAGAVGAIFAQKSTFLGELCGCQVESGAAAAMVAAAVVEMKKGTVKQSLDAASIALQNVLGMECNPVGGLMEIPCINRNALGAVNALMSADIVLAGVESVIPYDEVVEKTYEIGKNQPLQCTAKGGIATTPTGIDIIKHIHAGKFIKK